MTDIRMICILAFMTQEFSKRSSGMECDIYIQTHSDWTTNSPGLVIAGNVSLVTCAKSCSVDEQCFSFIHNNIYGDCQTRVDWLALTTQEQGWRYFQIKGMSHVHYIYVSGSNDRSILLFVLSFCLCFCYQLWYKGL